MICYILNPHIKQKYHCTSPLAYKHCKKNMNTQQLNTSPTHFTACKNHLDKMTMSDSAVSGSIEQVIKEIKHNYHLSPGTMTVPIDMELV